MSSLENIIGAYTPISLSDMDSVALMNRIDTKHQVSVLSGLDILQQLSKDYRILEIEGKRKFQYVTTYYDTADRFMLNEHLRGKLNRTKVRVRKYVESNKTFLEVKLKTNKGRTIKSRIEKIGDANVIDTQEADFLNGKSSVAANKLNPVIDLDFYRVTLVSTAFKERITFDFNLTFSKQGQSKPVDDLVIVELKRDSEGALRSPITKVLKKLAARPSSMSKYCTGMILFNETNRYNRYKPKLLKLNQLSSNGNIW
jgi:inorganic triphosphatase YgiF